MLFTYLYFLDNNLDNPIVVNGKDIELEFDKKRSSLEDEYNRYSREYNSNKKSYMEVLILIKSMKKLEKL